MAKIYNIPLSCNFFRELARIVTEENDITKIFIPNNRGCRAFKRELSRYNCIAPEIISISDVLKFPDINFLLLKFLKERTRDIPFSTLFDLAESLSTLIRNLIFNRADYRRLMIPDQFNESWHGTLAILDMIFENSEIEQLKIDIETQMDDFFSSLSGEKIVVAGLLEENFYNRLIFSKALDSGFVVASGLENPNGVNFQKINRMFGDRNFSIEHRGNPQDSDRRIIEVANGSDEAMAIALAVRESVEFGKSVLIASSNLSLTQKIKTELLKWNIIADDSSGVALRRTTCGQIISQIITTVSNGFRNVDMINLLKFNDSVRNSVFEWEKFLRNRESYPLSFFQTFEQFVPKKEAFFEKIDLNGREEGDKFSEDESCGEAAPNAFLAQFLRKNFSDEFVSENSDSFLTLQNMVENLKYFEKFPNKADFNFWRGYFFDFMNLINEHAAQEFADILKSQDFSDVSLTEFGVFLKNHLLNTSLRKNINYTEGVVILGILESQLADADLVIIADANENSWKSSGTNDFWMSDSMLRQLNINTIDERNEFYACVWEKLINKPNVLITRALSENGEMTQSYGRLKNCDTKQDVNLKNLLLRIKSPMNFSPANFCAPSPSAEFRPTTFWVSDLDLLISDPYVYYAKKILKLKELARINEQKNLRGNVIHKIFDEFVRRGIFENRSETLRKLFEKICREKFINIEFLGLWYFNVDSILKFFADNFNANAKSFSEIEGDICLKISHETKSVQIKIASKADRLEVDAEGNVSIVDYKTGEIPSAQKVKNGEKIQLPIEAIIAKKDGFKLGKTKVEKMSFWQLKPNQKKIVDISKNFDETDQICEEILKKIEEIIKNYIIFEKPYELNTEDKYNHLYMQLAREKEFHAHSKVKRDSERN